MLIIQAILRRRELIILALMLEFLHFSIWLDVGSPLSRSLLLIHLGIFLIWQPVWQSDEQLSWYNASLFVLLALAFVNWMNWWLLFAWLIVLTGFAGGRVLIHQQERAVYMIVLIFLVSETIIKATPMLFQIDISKNINDLFMYTLPMLPLLVTLLPTSPEKSAKSVDFLHSITSSTLLSLLIIGSLLNMFIQGTEYLTALIYTLITIAIFLFVISWLLSPRLGFSGLSQLWSRSLLNIGTPFEEWISELSMLAQQQQEPDEFVEIAVGELVNLPWVAGARWKTDTAKGEHGELTHHEVEINTEKVTVCIYSYNVVGGSLYLHCKLLIQLIGNLYIGKIKEKELTQQIHLQAIYETGARVTHDIKNLLQSLQAITSIINYDSGSAHKSVSQSLLEKQLPNLTQRLQLALDKLQSPDKISHESVYLKDWWHDFQIRNDASNVSYHADMSGDPMIPAELFDSIADNLLENLRGKAQIQPNLNISISLACNEDNIHLLIADNGTAIPEDIAKSILKEPIKSDNGLGIGLYQAARQAESLNYALSLKHNQDGNICFELSNKTNS